VDNVVYSINDGDEWRTCKFTDVAFDVSNIRVDPEWDSMRFILYGNRDINGNNSAVIIQLDFEPEYSGQCAGQDIEQWSPTDENGHCVLGLAQKYIKRLKGKTCYFGQGFNPKVGATRCNCSIADYECAHCFYRPDLQSVCTKECDIDPQPIPTNECENSDYFSTDKAYRIVENSACILDPKQSPPKGLYKCYGTPYAPNPAPSSFIPILLVAVVFLGGLIFLGYVLYKKNNEVRDFITYTLGFNLGQPTTTDSNYSTVETADSNQASLE
jgi:hypothetical protein